MMEKDNNTSLRALKMPTIPRFEGRNLTVDLDEKERCGITTIQYHREILFVERKVGNNDDEPEEQTNGGMGYHKLQDGSK